jgi:host factor-I protein
MDSEAGGIQNEFFNRARKDRALVTVFLTNGKRLMGRIRAFDKFTILLETHHGDQMVFKHAISTVGPARAGTGDEDPVGASHAAERREPGS